MQKAKGLDPKVQRVLALQLPTEADQRAYETALAQFFGARGVSHIFRRTLGREPRLEKK